MEKEILFCGYDFEQKYHRGISFYSKAVIKTCSELGYKNSILTSAPSSSIPHIQELQILQKLYDPTPFEKGSLKKNLVKMFLNKIGLMTGYSRVIPKFIDHGDPKLNYLQYVNSFINKPNFYVNQSIQARIFDKPLYINFHDAEIFFATSPLSIKARNSVKIIQSLHDMIPLLNITQPNDNPLSFHRRIKNALEYSHKVVAVSEYSKYETLKVFPQYENKIEVTYQPVPIYPEEELLSNEIQIQYSVLESYGLEKNRYFLYTGFLEKRKNIENIISAYVSIKDKVKIPLVLAGEIDKNDSDLKKLIASSKPKNVIYLGYIPTISKLSLIRNATAFVFPSLYEGFGIPPIEAMKLGCPVISSNNTSLGEVCEDSALLVNPQKMSEIANAMEEILENKNNLRETLIKKGYIRADYFSYDNYKSRLIKVLES